MAVTEKSGFLKYKDAAGNTTLMYPITTKDNVDGMDEIDAHIASTDNPHNVTVDQIGAISYSAQSLSDEQKIQARSNIGVRNPDWDQTDEAQADFIKNKPNEDDALAILLEMGFINPVVASDGSVFTDNNGALYSL